MWTAKEKIGLPVWNDEDPPLAVGTVHKMPGETITVAEMKAAMQDDEQIAELVKYGSIEEA